MEQTVGKLLEGKKPGARGGASRLRIVDPACGSGSFLIGAYEYLLDWHRDEYVKDGPEKHRKVLYQGAGGQWMLTTDEKKRILLNNIYGVDIDPQAVEATKLSLLLKVLEGESSETLVRQLSMFYQRVLPDLSNNIKCGNSLVAPDFYSHQQMSLFSDEVHYRVNAFGWQENFPEIMASGGFNAVIGNPPWLMAGYHNTDTLDYLRDHFASATGKFDLYYPFIEQGCRLLSHGGVFGMILPNKFFHTSADSRLRGLLADRRWLREVVDFGDEQVFASATNYSCILLLETGLETELRYRQVKAGLVQQREFTVPWSTLQEGTWHFEEQTTRKIFEHLEELGEPLEHLTERFGTGVQSGADRVLTVDAAAARSQQFEEDLLRQVLRGRDVRRYAVSSTPKQLIFPYKKRSDKFMILFETELMKHESIWKHLLQHKDKLAKRVWFGKNAQELSGEWYGMMYLDSPRAFEAPHLLTPSLSDRSNFAIGSCSLFATGMAGVTSIIPKASLAESIYYLLGVLNSKLLSHYAISHSPVFAGGYYKFSAPYLRRLRIRRISFSDSVEVAQHDRIVTLAQQKESLCQRHADVKVGQERTIVQRQIDATDYQIDQLVYELYGLTEEEIAVVEGA